MNEKPVRTPVIVYQTKQEPTDDFTGKVPPSNYGQNPSTTRSNVIQPGEMAKK